MSDPGAVLVAAAARAGVAIVAVPGPCAAIVALTVAALPTDRFAFEGFLPSKASARRKALAALVPEPRTLVFYEAPHRLVETLADLSRGAGPRSRGQRRPRADQEIRDGLSRHAR